MPMKIYAMDAGSCIRNGVKVKASREVHREDARLLVGG